MITLKDVVEENFIDCTKLVASDDRPNFVSISFGIAWIYRDIAKPMIIYKDGEPVGFLLILMEYNANGSTGAYLSRFMIDKSHQRKGYAKAAMHAVIDYIKQNTIHKSFYLSYGSENIAAKNLYEGLGFLHDGETEHGEIRLRLHI